MKLLLLLQALLALLTVQLHQTELGGAGGPSCTLTASSYASLPTSSFVSLSLSSTYVGDEGLTPQLYTVNTSTQALTSVKLGVPGLNFQGDVIVSATAVPRSKMYEVQIPNPSSTTAVCTTTYP